MNEYERRKRAREAVASNYADHIRRQGGSPQHDEIQRYVNERAASIDAKKDRGKGR